MASENFTSGSFGEMVVGFSKFHDYQLVPVSGAGYSVLYTVISGERKLFLKAVNRQEGSEAENLARLQREYKQMERLFGNDHIVRCIDWRDDPKVGPCIVMEYIDGMRLGDFLNTKPSAKERKRILLELLDALEFIHSHQVVHNDLKPENILITRNGHNVKLIDFGYADSDADLEKATGGTTAYASPELLNQEATNVTSDIFSLGFVIKALFPYRYGRVVRKCQRKTASKRFQGVAMVGKAMRQSDRFKWLALVMIALAVILLAWPKRTMEKTSASEQTESVPQTITVADTVLVVQEKHDTIKVEVPTKPNLEVVKVMVPEGLDNNDLNQDSLIQVYLDLHQHIEQERNSTPQLQLFRNEESGLFGYENKIGEVVIPAIYQDAQEFAEGYAVCCLDGKYGFVATDGSQHLFNYKEIFKAYGNRKFYVGRKRSPFTKIFIIGLNPLPVEMGMYDDIQFVFGELITEVRWLGMYGYLAPDGSELMPPKLKARVKYKDNGLFIAETEDGKGVVNSQFQPIIDLKYPFVKEVDGGIFLYGQFERCFGVITKNGKISIKEGYFERTDYLDGLFMILARTRDGAYTIVNIYGQEIVPKSESIIVSEGIAIIKNGDETQFLNLSSFKKPE